MFVHHIFLFNRNFGAFFYQQIKNMLNRWSYQLLSLHILTINVYTKHRVNVMLMGLNITIINHKKQDNFTI